MTTERIQIIITDRGTRRVRRNIRGIGQDSVQSSSAVDFLKKALLALGGVQIIRNLTRLADTFTNIQNRLKLVTDGTDELRSVTDELFAIANRTRGQFEATAEIYSRTALATRELGRSQAETLAFTETLNQAVILSGASSQEAAAGLIQLSQGLASGTLRGDELRSVLEQLPFVADIIAKSLGVTRGELRKLGTQGQITAEIIFDAFRNAREEIADRFAETVPTIGQSLTILRNEFLRFIGEVDRSRGITESASRAILSLANNFDVLSQAILATSIFLGVNFARTAITRAIIGLNALRIALLTNPFGLILTAISGIVTALTAIGSALFVFRNDIKITSDGVVTLNDLFKATGTLIREAFSELGPLFTNLIDQTRLFISVLANLEISIADVLLLIARGSDETLRNFQRLRLLGQGAFVALFAGVPTLVQNTLNSIGSFVEFTIDLFTVLSKTIVSTFKGALDIVEQAIRNVAVARDQLLEGDFAGAINAIANNASLFRNTGDILGRSTVEGFKEAFEQAISEDLIPDLSLGLEGVATASIEQIKQELRDLDENVRPFEESVTRILDIARDISNARRAAEEDSAEIFTLPVQLVNGADQVRSAFGERSQQILQGFRDGLKAIKLDLEDVAVTASRVVTNAFREAEDAFVEFAQTGEFNFSKLVDSIQADLARLLFRESIAGLFGGFGSGGGFGGLLGGLFGGGVNRAAGGPVQAGQLAAVGGRDPELIVPGVDSMVIPMRRLMEQAAAQPAPVVNLTIMNIVEPDDQAAALGSGSTDDVVINSIRRNPKAARQAIGI